MTSALATDYSQRIRTFAPGADVDFIAHLFARDLMKGDPEKCKAGYTADNAMLATLEMFPEADRTKLEVALDLREPDPEPPPAPKPCQVCGRPTSQEVRGVRKPGTCLPDFCDQRVVIVETHVGHYEQVEHLISHPITLTADHIELTVEVLISHAREKLNPDAIVVADATGWMSAADWLAANNPTEGWRLH